MVDEQAAEKIAQFEARMSAVERDDPDRAEACRRVRNMLLNARHVVEGVLPDGAAERPEIILSVHAAIADELEDIREARRDDDDDDDDGEEGDGEFA